MRPDPLAQIMPMKVAAHLDAVVGPQRQLIEWRKRGHALVLHRAVRLEAHPRDPSRRPAARQHTHQREKGMLALPAHTKVDRAVSQTHLRVFRRKVSTPHDWHIRQPQLQRTRHPDARSRAAARSWS